MSCECTWSNGTQDLERICLSHLQWLLVIDDARTLLEPLQDCDQAIRDWLAMAKSLPRSAEFPLTREPQKAAARVKP